MAAGTRDREGEDEAMPGDLRAQRQAHVQLLERTLSQLTAQLKAMPEVQQVILFGSYAAGRRDLFTDLDVIVMAESA
jgi:hypothetical protein